jgi:DNA-binding MarR family transcriptional regulator
MTLQTSSSLSISSSKITAGGQSLGDKVITDMITWRLHALTSLAVANATLRYGRKFSLTPQEWRALSILGAFAPLSLKDLYTRAQLEKAFASRTVSGLVERGFVTSQKSTADGRGVVLSLTPHGRRLYKKVFADALQRNENFVAGLSLDQRASLDEMLGVMTANARRMVELERRLANDGPQPSGNLATTNLDIAGADKDPSRSAEVRYLVARLSQLVGLA